MSGFSWVAEIEASIDSAKTLGDIRKLQQELEELENSVDKTEGSWKELSRLTGEVGKALSSIGAKTGAAGKDFSEAEQKLESFNRQFRQLVQGDVAGGSLDGGGLERMRQNFQENETEMRQLIATHEALKTSGVGAARAISREVEREIATNKRALEVAQRRQEREASRQIAARDKARAGADQQIFRYFDTSAEQNMDRAAAAAHRYHKALRQLAAADQALAASRKSGVLVDQTAAFQKQEAAYRSLTSARNEYRKAAAAEADQLVAARNRMVDAERAWADIQTAGNESKLETARRRVADATNELASATARLKAAESGGSQGEITSATNARTQALQNMASAQRDLQLATDASTGSIESQRYALYEVGGMYAAMSLAIFTAARKMITGFAEFESQMSNVQRTSGLVTTEAFAPLQKGLIELGDTIGTTQHDLNEMAIAAGQLGIEGTSNVLQFTEAMSKFVAISDSVTARDAAEQFGRIANLLGTQDWDALASSVAKVGVNAAATDAEILKTTEELAQAAAGANFAAHEVVGLAAAFASLGVPPERARSVMNDFVQSMVKGLAAGGGAIEEVGRLLGITTDQAANLWRTNPSGALIGIVDALKDMNEVELSEALANLGVKGQRAVPVFQALAKDARNAGDGMSVLKQALIDAKIGFDEASEIDSQYALKMDDLATAWTKFQNTLTTTSATLISHVAPALGFVLEGVQGILKMFRDLVSNPVGGTIAGIALGLTAMAGATFAVRGGMALATAGLLAYRTATAGVAGQNATLAGQLRLLAGQFLGVGAAASASSGGMATAATTMGKFKAAGSAALGIFGGPWGLAITAAAVGLGIFTQRVEEAKMPLEDMAANIEKSKSALETQVAILTRASTDFYNHTVDLERFNKSNRDAAAAAHELGEAMRNGYNPDWTIPLDETQRRLQLTANSLKIMGQELAQLAETDTRGAATAFKQMTQDIGHSEQAMIDFLDSMPAFKEQMYEQGKAAGVVTAGIDTYEGKLQTVQYIMGVAAQQSETFTHAIFDTSAAAQDASGSIEDMVEQLENYADNVWRATDAQWAWNKALHDANQLGSIQEEGIDVNFDAATGEWSGNVDQVLEYQQALKALTETGYENAAAILYQTGSVAEMEAALIQQRDQFYETALAMGFTEEQAAALTEKYFGIPANITTELLTNGTFDAAKLDIETIITLVEELPEGKSFTVTGLTDEAKARLEELGYKVETFPNGESTITANTEGAQRDLQNTRQRILDIPGDKTISITTVFTEIYRRITGDSGPQRNVGGGRRRGYATGGFTGRGHWLERAGDVHRGEYVIPKRDVNQQTGLPKPEALGKLLPQNYAASSAGAAPANTQMPTMVDLGPGTIRELARAVQTHLELDGRAISRSVSRSYDMNTVVGGN